jgi:hypothetical protein
MSRICARPGCNVAAAATLSYAYGAAEVWIDELAGSDHPMTHDMCADHADSLRVPIGWTLRDRRGAAGLHLSQARLITA